MVNYETDSTAGIHVFRPKIVIQYSKCLTQIPPTHIVFYSFHRIFQLHGLLSSGILALPIGGERLFYFVCTLLNRKFLTFVDYQYY